VPPAAHLRMLYAATTSISIATAAAFEADPLSRFRAFPTHARDVATCPDSLLLRAAPSMKRQHDTGRMPL